MAGFWIHPNGRPEGGGGEFPEVITWGMIQGKPTEFKPIKHNHEMEEIINLEETISEIYVMINDKVSKETGKQLSEENFTTALKEKLESMENGTAGVISVNGKEGQHIQITKNDLGLGNVLDVAQVSQEEFNTLKERVDNLVIEGETVTSVNGMTGEVVVTKETLDLNKVLNETQATKAEFDTHTQDSSIHVTTQEKELWNAKEDSESVQSKIDSASLENMEYTDSKIANKVDKEVGKGLSSNDFTNEYVNKVEQFDTLSTAIQTLNTEMDIRPNVKTGTNELEKELLSSKESNLKQPNLKNIVIVNSLEELNSIEPYQGLIAIISSKE